MAPDRLRRSVKLGWSLRRDRIVRERLLGSCNGSELKIPIDMAAQIRPKIFINNKVSLWSVIKIDLRHSSDFQNLKEFFKLNYIYQFLLVKLG